MALRTARTSSHDCSATLQYQKFIDALGLPKFIQRPVAKLNQERTGVDMVEKSFLPNVKDIDVPTLIVQNSNDPWTDMNLWTVSTIN